MPAFGWLRKSLCRVALITFDQGISAALDCPQLGENSTTMLNYQQVLTSGLLVSEQMRKQAVDFIVDIQDIA